MFGRADRELAVNAVVLRLVPARRRIPYCDLKAQVEQWAASRGVDFRHWAGCTLQELVRQLSRCGILSFADSDGRISDVRRTARAAKYLAGIPASIVAVSRPAEEARALLPDAPAAAVIESLSAQPVPE